MNKITAKEQLKKSWEAFKKAWKNIIQTTAWATKTVWRTTEWLYRAIDAGDLAIQSKLWKSSNKVLDFTKRNILKILIVASVLTHSWNKIYQNQKDKNKDNMEQYFQLKENDSNFLDFNNIEQNTFWNNSIFFDKDFGKEFVSWKTIEEISEDLILKHDAWLTFYLMLPEDIKNNRVETINHIRNKLWNIPEFEYLKDDQYTPTQNEVTNTFNIRPDYKELAENSSLKKTPYWIPIPLKEEIRKIDNETFIGSAKIAIDLIWDYDQSYAEIWDKVLQEYTKDDIANLLTMIAMIETWQTVSIIWTDTYHRWELWKHQCFSFWPHHVLMKDWWLKARFNLDLTEWQIYHPVNSNMLVMWFMIEKIKERSLDKDGNVTISNDIIAQEIIKLLKFMKNTNLNTEDQSLISFCRFYNWTAYKGNDYDNKIITAMKLVKIPSEYKTNKWDFTFSNIDSKGENLIYYYNVPANTDTSNKTLNIEKPDDIIKKFKKTYKTKSNQIQVTRRNWNKYSDDAIFQSWDIVYIKFHTSDAK